MNEKIYRLEPPMGHTIVTRRRMNEQQVRHFAMQINQGDNAVTTDLEKGPIEDVLVWLERHGFKVIHT